MLVFQKLGDVRNVSVKRKNSYDRPLVKTSGLFFQKIGGIIMNVKLEWPQIVWLFFTVLGIGVNFKNDKTSCDVISTIVIFSLQLFVLYCGGFFG